MHPEKNYLHLLEKLVEISKDKNNLRKDRTGTGTYSIFGSILEFDMNYGLPILTTKKIQLKSVIYELLWFLHGDTNIKFLKDNGVNIWNEWADENGELGPVYGKQWRAWEDKNGNKIDQIKNVINSIKTNPYSRRHIVSAWNVGELKDMSLPPCHILFQFFVENNKLSLQMYQRSADVFLGLPFDIASYSILLHIVAKLTNLEPLKFIWVGGDVHLYSNHIEQAKIQLSREPFAFPQIKLKDINDIDNIKYDDIIIENYIHHSIIKAPISV